MYRRHSISIEFRIILTPFSTEAEALLLEGHSQVHFLIAMATEILPVSDFLVPVPIGDHFY